MHHNETMNIIITINIRRMYTTIGHWRELVPIVNTLTSRTLRIRTIQEGVSGVVQGHTCMHAHTHKRIHTHTHNHVDTVLLSRHMGGWI